MPIAVGLIVASVLLYLRPGAGRRLVLTAAIAFWTISTPLGGRTLAFPLARGFTPLTNAADARPAGAIVVLGGGIDENRAGDDVLARPSRATAFRILEGARVFRLLGGRPIVIASGGRPYERQVTPESAVIAEALVALHVPRERIVTEDQSLNTHDEAVIITRMLRARGIGTIVLVTSPPHMWRSVAVFRAQGADVIPSPAPLGATEPDRPETFVPDRNALQVSSQALYDYVGIVYYWARGWLRPETVSR